MYCELLRSFDSLTDANSGGIINLANYSNDDCTAATDVLGVMVAGNDPAAITRQKRFVAGIDLDRFNRSSEILMSGSSSVGQMVNLNLTFGAGLAESVNLYASVMFDVHYNIEGGKMTSRF